MLAKNQPMLSTLENIGRIAYGAISNIWKSFKPPKVTREEHQKNLQAALLSDPTRKNGTEIAELYETAMKSFMTSAKQRSLGVDGINDLLTLRDNYRQKELQLEKPVREKISKNVDDTLHAVVDTIAAQEYLFVASMPPPTSNASILDMTDKILNALNAQVLNEKHNKHIREYEEFDRHVGRHISMKNTFNVLVGMSLLVESSPSEIVQFHTNFDNVNKRFASIDPSSRRPPKPVPKYRSDGGSYGFGGDGGGDGGGGGGE